MFAPFRTSASSVVLAAAAASVALLAPRPAVAQQGQEGDQAAMREAFAEASTPGPAHEILAKMTGDGTYDEASRTMNFVSTYTDPYTKSEKKTRDVIRFVSDDEFVYESFEEGPDGSERKTMEIVYDRIADRASIMTPDPILDGVP